MSELIIGVLFSAGFALTYLCVAKLLKSNGRRLFCCAARKSVTARPAKLFMTTGELSKHHSGESGV